MPRALNPKILAIAAIWLATAAAYSNSFTISFQFDDTHTVQSNLYVRSLRYVPRYFVDPNTSSYRPENSGYRPMTTLALALGFAMSGMNTWGYHLIKLLEHCLAATLVFLVGLRLLPSAGSAAPARFWIAWFGGLLFGVHRANTETVDYICAVSTLQAGLFYLLAFYLYLRRREGAGKAHTWLSVLCYTLANMSKEEAITLPAMILIHEVMYATDRNVSYFQEARRRWKRLARLVLPYAAAGVFYLVLRVALPAAVADTSRGNTPTYIYAITQLRSWLFYWKLFFWPVTLNADNLAFDFSPGLEDWRVWAAGAAHVSVWLAAWFAGKRRKFVFFAVLWSYVTILPAASVFRLVEAVNEHRMYIPYMGLSLLLAWALFTAAARATERLGASHAKGRAVAAAVLLAFCAAQGVGAHARNEVWQTDRSLWEDVLAKNPDSPRAMNVLGVALINQGDYVRSKALLERCHVIVPAYLPCVVHLSMIFAHEHRYQDGLALLKAGHLVDPSYVHVNYHLGFYYKDFLGDFESARPFLTRAHELSSGRFFQATVKLAEILLEEGKVQEGIRLASSVLAMDYSNGDAWEAYGKGYLLAGDLQGAHQVFYNLYVKGGQSTRFSLGLANVLERRGALKEALSVYGNAVTKSPDCVQGWIAIARVAKRLGSSQAETQARAKLEEMRKSGAWTFYASMFLPGEKRAQVAPEWAEAR